jgi:preprotein translocase subunit SecD
MMKWLRVVSVFLLLGAGTILVECRGNRERDMISNQIEIKIMDRLHEEQAVSEWWKHDLPQREENIAIQELPLHPAFTWSFSIQNKKTTLIHGIEHIVNEYILQRATYEFESLKILATQNPDTELPGQYSFFIPKAKEIYQMYKEAVPPTWTAETTLSGFLNEREAFSYFKYHFFEDFYHAKKGAEIFDISTASDNGMKITIEPDIDSITEMTGVRPTALELNKAADRAITILTNLQYSLHLEAVHIQKIDDATVTLYATPYDFNSERPVSFCLIDEERTQLLQEFASAKPGSIFDKDGNIIVQDIPVSDLLVRGYYRIDPLKETFSTSYLVFDEVTGLETNHIEKIESGKDFMNNPEIVIQLNDEGGELFYQITSENIKRPLAILMNDHVLMTAIIQEPIRDAVRITGFDEEEARNIVKQLHK